MSVNLAYNRFETFFDTLGAIAPGGKLFTYVGGSVNTKQTTYTESTGTTPNTNPIVLDSAGRLPQPLWITAGASYKFVLAPSTDTDPPASPIWTLDRITGINDSTNVASEWIAGPAPTFVSATSFTLVGDQTVNFSTGRRTKTTNTGGTIYSTIVNSTFGAVTTVTVKNDSGILDAGLSAVSYGLISASHPALPAATINAQPVCNGRLTLTTATPVTTADVTAATSVFFALYKGNTVDLYDGSANWNRFTFTELTLAVPAAASQMYDVFLQNNAGTLQLNAVAWTNDTTRATALTTQNGVLVKTGSTGQLYLGSFRTTTVAGQTEDSLAKRYVWNYYNRVERSMQVLEATDSWAYTLATFRQARATASNQLDFILGVAEDAVEATVSVTVSSDQAINQASPAVGIGLDSTTTNSALLNDAPTNPGANARFIAKSFYRGTPTAGRHTLVWLEQDAAAAGTTTWRGDNGTPTYCLSGICGKLRT